MGLTLKTFPIGQRQPSATTGKILVENVEANRNCAPITGGIGRRMITTVQKQAPGNVVAARLAPREQEILELVANGDTNKEIADKLSITLGTVCWYLNATYKKLNVRNRIQAVNKFRLLTDHTLF